MLKNYLKIAWRNLAKNKVFSFINILGLTIGTTCCMMIFLYIMNEFGVDKFHADKKNIYRVMRGFDMNGTKLSVPYLSGPYAPALLNDYAGSIKKAVRVMHNYGLVTLGNNSFNEKKLYVVDSNFFSFFTFPLVSGNAATVLKDPASVVLTETAAKKYFGNQDPIGKIVELDKSLKLKVTGIAKDVPSNSHLDFDMVVPISNYANEEWIKIWINNNNFTYVLLNDNVQKASLEKSFPKFMDKYMGKDLARFGAKMDLSLTPMSDIYFEPHSAFDNVKHGDKKVVYIFLSIAALILLIACINFTNLSTIRAVERSKEVGLRKVMGALRNHLVYQFIGESVLITLISCLLSLGLLKVLMPVYNHLLGYSLTISWNAAPLYLFLVGVIICVGFLAGSYPAVFLSGFTPIQALKGKLKLGKGGSFFRQTLVVVQFSISVFLVIGTIIIMSQMRYVKNMELGYNQEHSIVLPVNNDMYNNRQAFKNELENLGSVASVSYMSGEPGGFFDMHTLKAEGRNDLVWKTRTEFTDFDYVKTLGLKIIAGRDFSGAFSTDTTEAALINRTAAKSLGFTPEQAIGKWVQNTIRDDKKRRIVGVIEDFNFLSLKEKMDALVITPNDDHRVVVIRLKSGNVTAALAEVKSAFAKISASYPFEYTFLDQKFDELYKTDIRQQTILSIFAGLAIFIACLGLFGLASFTATKRTKEIGVRKVLGSSTQGIVVLLSRELLKPVILATCVAIPAGYFAMNSWLQNFSYRTPMHWWIFAVAASLTIGIALFTISFKAIRAALMNPVTSLRSE
ncbi:ABC transporter permease [Dyadobacter arcticus]|uniref:ABC transport system permease protein n=1 Tax=Dyadobacter arcticus TaxID=1078754 RepID=A0ABX0UH28_9BACT|nr:ABC transporter permease [Dyadobacter arcticus]NIJ51808.1 putative ABC transport system permease protein [Dyadobacter arcticus]